MRDQIVRIVELAFEEVNLTRAEKIPVENIQEIALYGDSGVFDSMHLVSFLTIVEEKLEDEIDVEVSLTSEKAVSRKVSPFSGVTALIEFIEEELQGELHTAALVTDVIAH